MFSLFSLLYSDSEVEQRPTNPLCVAVDLVRRMMKEKGFVLCHGRVYKREAKSKHTFSYHSPVKEYLHASLSNWEVANVLISHVNQISSLLSNPKCGLIKPLKIDYNLIKVLPAGTCFHIAGKRFEFHEKLKPGYFPRAFIEYIYDKDKVPNPKPFIECKLSYFTLFFIVTRNYVLRFSTSRCWVSL